MQRILEEIKSVQGITGVLIWDKRRLNSYQLFPASFTASVIKSTCSKLVKLAQNLGPSAKVKLFFNNGIAIILSRPQALILVLGQANLNFSFLDLVLSSCLLRLDKLLSSKKMEKIDFPPLEQEKVNYLIEGMNLLSGYLVEKIGAYRATQDLRQAKEKLIVSHPFMANLFVDNNAHISIIKGREGMWSGEIVLAFAKWAAYLEKLSFKKQRKVDLKKITSSLEKNLEEMGFYFIFDNIKENI